MDEQQLAFVLKFAQNQHSEKEHDQFLEWLETAPQNEIRELLELYPQIESLVRSNDDRRASLVSQIESRIEKQDNSSRTFFLWPQAIKLVATLALLAGAALLTIYFYRSYPSTKTKTPGQQIAKSVKVLSEPPGSITLTLADGSTIVLDSAGKGLVAKQGETSINKTADGKIVYNESQRRATGSLLFNMVSVPRGKQFQLVLEDGTKVWLNAGSSIRFPTVFNSQERSVDLVGEAYFEVVVNKEKPFKVNSRNQTIEVLGTHFNVTAYPDEEVIRTTLLEGSVRLLDNKNTKTQLLRPGQQASLIESFSIKQVDPFESTVWKDGFLNFAHEDIYSVMKKIARWYDVEIQYKGSITTESFMGKISRFQDVSEVLQMLERTGAVHFQINGRTIIVLP